MYLIFTNSRLPIIINTSVIMSPDIFLCEGGVGLIKKINGDFFFIHFIIIVHYYVSLLLYYINIIIRVLLYILYRALKSYDIIK